MSELNLNGLTPVPSGKIATIVTNLAMTAAPTGLRRYAPEGTALVRITTPAPDWYRALFRTIGEDYLWTSRLLLDTPALNAIIRHPLVEIYALRREERDIGLLELDFRDPGSVEVAFFGLVPGETGKGTGRWLMDEALALAWRHGPERVWIHTCTLDHPSAVHFYRACGFAITGADIELMDDPRLSGLIHRNAAPHIPILA